MGRFVRIAMRSASELDYLTFLATDLGYLSRPQHAEVASELNEIRRMLTGMFKQMRAPIGK